MTGTIITDTWKRFEGEVIGGKFRLGPRLSGGESHAVFQTEYGEGAPLKAAVKLIPANAPNADALLWRWKSAAELSHPHLLRLLDMGRCRLDDSEMLYLVMEYAEEDLARVLAGRPLGPEEVREMARPVLDALAYLHSKGFVHGHIKPANIMAVGEQVKISSDGSWRMAESSGAPEMSGPYDPPEAGGKASPAADVWSLGMTLVEVLTQRLPVWDRKDQREPVLPPSLPAEFVDLTRHCLRRDPQLRWTVADVAARLRGNSAEPPRKLAPRIAAPPANWSYIIPIVALVLAAVLAGPILVRHRPAKRRAQSVSAERPATSVNSSELSAEKKPQQQASVQKPHTAETAPAAAAKNVKTSTGKPIKGSVVHQVLPEIPEKASDTIRGTVRVSVKVSVDPLGAVSDATLDSAGPSQYFASKSLQAAREWKFEPAKVDDQEVASEWVLRFEYQQTGTTVHPVEVTP